MVFLSKAARARPKLSALLAVALCGGVVLATGCIRVPNSLVKLSNAQMENIQRYNKAVASLIDSYKTDAEALIKERERQYDVLRLRGEAWHKELYRLLGGLRGLELFDGQTTTPHPDLTDEDKGLVISLQTVLNTTIKDFVAAEAATTELAAIAELALAKKKDEVTKKFESKNLERFGVSADKFKLLVAMDGNEQSIRVVLASLDEKVREKSVKMRDNYRKHTNALIKQIVELETFLDDTLPQKLKAFRAQARPELKNFVASLDKLKQDGIFIEQTQSDVTHAIKKLQEFKPPVLEIAKGFSGFASTLGEAGVIKPNEANKVSQMLTGLREDILGGKEQGGGTP